MGNVRIALLGPPGSGKTTFLASLIQNIVARRIGIINKKSQKYVVKIVTQVLSLEGTDEATTNIDDVELEVSHHYTGAKLCPKLRMQTSDVAGEFFSVFTAKEKLRKALKNIDLIIVFIDFTTGWKIDRKFLIANPIAAVKARENSGLRDYIEMINETLVRRKNSKFLFLATKKNITGFSEEEFKLIISQQFAIALAQTKLSNVEYFVIDSYSALNINDDSMMMCLNKTYKLLDIKFD